MAGMGNVRAGVAGLVSTVAVILGVAANFSQVADWAGGAFREKESVSLASGSVDASVRRPIDEIFAAWETQDIDRYMAQWAPDATRTTLGGDAWDRRTLLETRKRQFGTFSKVTQTHKLCSLGSDGERHLVYAVYSMVFYRPDKRPFWEENVKEGYAVVRDRASGRWLIQQNWDFETKAPC